MCKLTTRRYPVGEVWANLMMLKTIFCAANIPSDIPRAKKQIWEENAERLKLESFTTKNLLPKVKQEKKRIFEFCHAGPTGFNKETWQLYKKTLSSNQLDCFFTAVLVLYALQIEYCLVHKLSYIMVFCFHILFCVIKICECTGNWNWAVVQVSEWP